MKLVSDILLEQLGNKARRNEALRAKLAEALPPRLAGTLRHARVDGSVLHLTVDSAGAATRLRFCQRDLIGACPPDMQPVSVKFKVSPHTDRCKADVAVPHKRHKAQRISAAAFAHIDSVADSVENPSLRDALRRLARRRPSS